MTQTPKAGTLYLMPTLLSDVDPATVIPRPVLEIASQLDFWIVENARTTRRYLGLFKNLTPPLNLRTPLQSQRIEVLQTSQTLAELTLWVKAIADRPCGLMSEAGMPAIADPGSKVVQLAHQYGITVKPLTGPNSILLALAASGLDGQRFVFHGYLPVQEHIRHQAILKTERSSQTEQQTQIAIETPYRNQVLLEALVKQLHPTTLLVVAQDLTGQAELIVAKSVAHWRENQIELAKLPTIFLWLASSHFISTSIVNAK